MTIFNVCCTLRDSSCRAFDQCFSCLSDPARRSALGLKVALVMLHLIYAGVLFLFDGSLMEKTETEPWYTGTYLTLFVITLVQYLVTSCSSPGFVLDAMRIVNEATSATVSEQPAASSEISVGVTVGGSSGTPWRKLVTDLYPLGTSISICSKCNAEQPPRSKHCRECERCVLQFDHHCPCLGTCIGVGNRFKYWCYIFEETALCLWTSILYITYLKSSDLSGAWWKDAIMIVMLVPLSIALLFLLGLLLFHSYLILTNQTTDELVRRRRITYLRGIPERVHPFSKGACGNIYEFCCLRSKHRMEPVPTALELEEKARPYTCADVVTCRCCWY